MSEDMVLANQVMTATMTSEKAKAVKNYGYIDKYHLKRRSEMLAAHPEIRSLMVEDPSFKYVAITNTITQLFIAYLLRDSSLMHVVLFALFVGSLHCCAITNSLHELVHDRAFPGKPLWNKVFGTVVNFGLAWPALGGYYTSHRYHHAFLGNVLDAKYPDMDEALYYDQSLWLRLVFIFKHPLVMGERWTKFVKEPPTTFTTANYYACWAFNIIWLYCVGWRSYLYLFVSFWIDDCIFIQGSKNFADHWVDDEKPYARSHYGMLNMINHNIGYHREHHDFPNIPGRYCPQLTELAKEYYSDPNMIVESVFGAVYDMFTAPYGKGITKHANKLTIDSVKVKNP